MLVFCAFQYLNQEPRALDFATAIDFEALGSTMLAILNCMSDDYRANNGERIFEVILRAKKFSIEPHCPLEYWGGGADDEVQIPDGSSNPATLHQVNDGDCPSPSYITFNLDSINLFMEHNCAVHGIFCGDHYYLANDERGIPINVDLPRFFNCALRNSGVK
jgi:hypothetical protein